MLDEVGLDSEGRKRKGIDDDNLSRHIAKVKNIGAPDEDELKSRMHTLLKRRTELRVTLSNPASLNHVASQLYFIEALLRGGKLAKMSASYMSDSHPSAIKMYRIGLLRDFAASFGNLYGLSADRDGSSADETPAMPSEVRNTSEDKAEPVSAAEGSTQSQPLLDRPFGRKVDAAQLAKDIVELSNMFNDSDKHDGDDDDDDDEHGDEAEAGDEEARK